jgi:hypothetical protein
MEEYPMMRHLMSATLLAAVAAIVLVQPVVAADAANVTDTVAKRNKLIFQVSDNDPAKWNLALNNASNVQQDIGKANVDIEIVAYGPGLGMLRMESPVGNRVADALRSGVRVVACENTMTNQKIGRDAMLPNLGYVAAGVVELMQRQQDGYAYIRP